jgi:hypothetical protein
MRRNTLAVAAAVVIAILLLAAGLAAWLEGGGRSQNPSDSVLAIRAQTPSPVHDPVAIANGTPVPASVYQGHLAMVTACIQNPACPEATNYRSLGAASVALTAVVDDILVEQYGSSHGVTVSDSEVTAELNQQVSTMRSGLAQGGATAASVRQNLAVGHLTDPSQIVSHPAWRDRVWHAILRGKVLQAFVTDKLPSSERGTPRAITAEFDFERSLQDSASVTINIGAHLIDPHLEVTNLTPAPAPPSTGGIAPQPSQAVRVAVTPAAGASPLPQP